MIKSEKFGIIFGISSLLGSNLALAMSAEGINLIIEDNSLVNLEKIEKKIKLLGKRQTYLHCKHQNPKNLEKLDLVLGNKFKKIDFFVSTIGNMGNLKPLTDLSLDEWCKIINSNLTANWYILKKTENFLRKSDNPKIFFFYNSEVSDGLPYYNGYSISKAALKTMVNLYKREKKKLNFNVKIFDIDKDNYCEISHLRPHYKNYNYESEVKKILKEILP